MEPISDPVAGRADAGNESLEAARPLTPGGRENLVAFTRLLGYVRHFHPSDAAAATDWNRFAVEGVRRTEDAAGAKDLARSLGALFGPVAPTVRVFPTGEHPPVPPELSPPRDAGPLRVTMWRHFKDDVYRSERLSAAAPRGRVPGEFPDPRLPYAAELGAGVSCLVPLALFADEAGTLPHASPPGGTPGGTAASDPADFSANDRATRLAATALAWNVLQHFYPYFDVVGTDWPQVLRSTLRAAAVDRDERAFLDTLRRLIARLHDGHGWVSHRRVMHADGAYRSVGCDTDDYLPPFGWSWVEDQLVVTGTGEGARDLRPGDRVLTVDGRPAADALAHEEEKVSAATPARRRYRALRELLAGPEGSQITLEVRHPSTEGSSSVTATVTARRTLLSWVPSDLPHLEPRPPKVHQLRPGIFYLDFDLLTDDEFYEVLPRLENAKGILIDMRGYPGRITADTLSHFTDVPITSGRNGTPRIVRPDRQHVWYPFTQWDPLQPSVPRLRAKIAFLADERAVSWAETYLGFIEHYRLAEIVGAPTAGTNGMMNERWVVAGGYQLHWTGAVYLKHDGSRHHGVGVLPTVPVSRTLRGIAEGRDEILERAVEVVSG